MEYREKIDRIVEEILKIKEDIIIVGDNSSGKSDILKSIIENLPQSECYYIDSCNRVFEYKNTLNTGDNLLKTEDILKARLEEENFNLKDSFGTIGNIERYYSIYKTEFLSLINEFLEKDIIIEEENGIKWDKVLKVDGEIYEYLSNGYQAIFRIFLELIYATKVNKNIKTIIIDEITEFLSAKNEAKILNFLREKFQNIRFIVTTHSEDIISNTPNTRLVIITEIDYEILDGDDFQTNTEIRRVFSNLFFNDKEDKDEKKKIEIESLLRKLYNKKLFGEWTEEDEIEIKKLEALDLTNSQKLLLKNIKEF
jgi:ABC-type cobalamin/Fe3+-siderophores transport system ATPase subunit